MVHVTVDVLIGAGVLVILFLAAVILLRKFPHIELHDHTLDRLRAMRKDGDRFQDKK